MSRTMQGAAARPLGSNQIVILRTLAKTNGGTWHADCGWAWDGNATTARLLNGLVRRGLVEHRDDHGRFGTYTITDAGRREVLT